MAALTTADIKEAMGSAYGKWISKYESQIKEDPLPFIEKFFKWGFTEGMEFLLAEVKVSAEDKEKARPRSK